MTPGSSPAAKSLMATLNMRLSAPEVLIDINHLKGLSEISCDGETLRSAPSPGILRFSSLPMCRPMPR